MTEANFYENLLSEVSMSNVRGSKLVYPVYTLSQFAADLGVPKAVAYRIGWYGTAMVAKRTDFDPANSPYDRMADVVVPCVSSQKTRKLYFEDFHAVWRDWLGAQQFVSSVLARYTDMLRHRYSFAGVLCCCEIARGDDSPALNPLRTMYVQVALEKAEETRDFIELSLAVSDDALKGWVLSRVKIDSSTNQNVLLDIVRKVPELLQLACDELIHRIRGTPLDTSEGRETWVTTYNACLKLPDAETDIREHIEAFLLGKTSEERCEAVRELHLRADQDSVLFASGLSTIAGLGADIPVSLSWILGVVYVLQAKFRFNVRDKKSNDVVRFAFEPMLDAMVERASTREEALEAFEVLTDWSADQSLRGGGRFDRTCAKLRELCVVTK